MSASYLYKQIVRGGLIYNEVFALETWKKHQAEVDRLLIENGYAHLIK